MKKKLSILFVLISINSNSQEIYSVKSVYSEIFRCRKEIYNGREFFTRTTVEIDSTHELSILINTSLKKLDYFLLHFTIINHQDFLQYGDSLELQNKFVKALQNDSLFNSVMDKFFNPILNASVPKDTFSLDEVMNIAVKFLYIPGISTKGYYQAKVCTGRNGIIKTEKNRNPNIEAFCFVSIFNNLNNEKYNLYDVFVEEIKKLYKINLGINKKERLLRAQGAIYISMSNSDTLKALLKDEYEKNKSYLPFILETK